VADQQTCNIFGSIQDGTIVLSSRDPNLQRRSDGTQVFTIMKGTPAHVVFLLDIADGGNSWVVRSSLRGDGDEWLAPVDWTHDRSFTSPTFVDGNVFRLDITRSRSTSGGGTVTGGGFFEVSEQGGGGNDAL
jgi:hypothetical protein